VRRGPSPTPRSDDARWSRGSGPCSRPCTARRSQRDAHAGRTNRGTSVRTAGKWGSASFPDGRRESASLHPECYLRGRLRRSPPRRERPVGRRGLLANARSLRAGDLGFYEDRTSPSLDREHAPGSSAQETALRRRVRLQTARRSPCVDTPEIASTRASPRRRRIARISEP
jgi:hypothetical protein